MFLPGGSMSIGRGTLGCLVACLSIGVIAGACDDQSDVPVDLLQQADPQTDPQNAAATRPTTQELVEGSRVPVTLDILPLILQVPASWKITRHGSGGANVWLEGPTPYGEAQIDLTQRPTVARREYDMFVKGIRRRIDTPSGRETIQQRQLGPMHIIDYREELPAAPMPVVDETGLPKLDASGEIVMETAVPMRWRQSIYVPRADHAEHYELRFVVLTKDQYEADRAFLEQIFASLRYVGAAEPGAAAPATEPAAPAPTR
jgi:hypothetical protein